MSIRKARLHPLTPPTAHRLRLPVPARPANTVSSKLSSLPTTILLCPNSSRGGGNSRRDAKTNFPVGQMWRYGRRSSLSSCPTFRKSSILGLNISVIAAVPRFRTFRQLTSLIPRTHQSLQTRHTSTLPHCNLNLCRKHRLIRLHTVSIGVVKRDRRLILMKSTSWKILRTLRFLTRLYRHSATFTGRSSLCKTFPSLSHTHCRSLTHRTLAGMFSDPSFEWKHTLLDIRIFA